jgi:hypothetical protein
MNKFASCITETAANELKTQIAMKLKDHTQMGQRNRSKGTGMVLAVLLACMPVVQAADSPIFFFPGNMSNKRCMSTRSVATRLEQAIICQLHQLQPTASLWG